MDMRDTITSNLEKSCFFVLVFLQLLFSCAVMDEF